MAASAVVGILRALLVADTAQFDKAMAGADTATRRLAKTMKEDLEPSQARINKLVRDFSGSQAIGMAKNYAEAIEKVGGVANLTAKHQEQVNAAMQKALAHYRAAGKEAPAHLLAIEQATRRLEPPTNRLATNFEMAAGKLKMLAGAFGVGLGVAGLVSFARSIFDTADHIVDMSDKMGVGTEAAQRFSFAAKQAGADIDDVGKAIVKMNDNLANGDKSTINALKDAGLNFQTIRAMQPEDAFRAIADAIAKIPDPMKQTQVAMDLFGKAGASILPMIRTGALEASDAITVMSDKTVRRLEAAKQSWENFLNAVTIVTGEALANAPEAWDTFFDQLEKRMKSLAGWWRTFMQLMADPTGQIASRSMLLDAASDAATRQETQQSWAGMVGSSDVQEVGGSGLFGVPMGPMTGTKPKPSGHVKTKAEIEAEDRAREKAAQKAIADAQRLQEAVEKLTGAKLRKDLADFTKQFTAAMTAGGIHKTEIDDTIKQIEKFVLAGENIDPAMMTWFTDASVNRILGNNAALQKSIFKTALTFDQLEVAAKKASLPISKTPWASLLSGAIPGATLAGQANTQDLTTLGDVVKKQLGNAANAFPELLVRAILHGQGLKRAFTAFGAQFGTEAGSAFLQKIGKMSEKTANMGVGFATFGVGLIIDDINQSAAEAEAAKEKLREINKQFKELGITLAEVDTIRKGIKASGFGMVFKAAPEVVLKTLQAAQTQIDKLKQSVVDFGGVVPRSLRPAIQELLKLNGLPEVFRKQLEALGGSPSWKVIEERAAALGIDPGGLGATFNQSKVKDLALGYVRDIEMFIDANADLDTVLRGMSDEISSILIQAQKTGAALPKTLEPFIKRLSEMGLLLDENGNAIDTGALSFQDFEDEALEAMKDLLTEIKDILAKAFPAAADAAAQAIGRMGEAARGFFGRPRQPEAGAPETPGFSFPDLATSNFVSPGIASAFDGSAAGYAGGMMTVVVEQDGRQMARLVAPYVPGEVKRLGLARV